MSAGPLTSSGNWEGAWRALGAAAPEGLRSRLLARYAEPHRAYHTQQHLHECFAALGPTSDLAEHLAEVELALWFHDAIYDTHAHDNEAQSARWAQESMRGAGVDAAAGARVHALVMATKHQGVPAGADARLLVDVDLSILGADETRFAEYERQIRFEYGWVPEDAYREGRARVLSGFLDRASIYGTPWFAERLEARARANLSRSLRHLKA